MDVVLNLCASPKGAVNWMAIILLCFAWDFDSLADEVLKVF